MTVAATIMNPALRSGDLTNGNVPATPQITESMLRERIQTMYSNARNATRVVYERGVGQDGENWIVRTLIFNALSRIQTAVN